MTHFPCRRNCCCSLPFLVVCLLLSKNKSPYDVKSFPCPSFLPDQNYHKHTDIYSDTNTNLRVILKVLRNIVVVGIVVLKLVGCNINTKLLLLLSFQLQGNISFFFTSYSNNNMKTQSKATKLKEKICLLHTLLCCFLLHLQQSRVMICCCCCWYAHTHTDNKEGNF